MNKTFVMVLLAGASMASCSSEDDIIGQEPTLAINRREKKWKIFAKRV